MRPALFLSALFFSIPAALCADMTEHEAYTQIAEGLRAEVRLLTSIVDAASAQETLPQLSRVIAELAALNSRVDERELWRYIDNTSGLKQPLIEETELLFVQLKRLEQARFFGNARLGKLLRPMLSPAS